MVIEPTSSKMTSRIRMLTRPLVTAALVLSGTITDKILGDGPFRERYRLPADDLRLTRPEFHTQRTGPSWMTVPPPGFQAEANGLTYVETRCRSGGLSLRLLTVGYICAGP